LKLTEDPKARVIFLNNIMITVDIEPADTIVYNRIRYVMAQLLVAVGFPFIILREPDKVDDNFTIACIPEDLSESYLSRQEFDLIIPYGDYAPWTADDANIKMDKIEGVPVLYIDRKPEFLIRDHRVGFDLINVVFFLLSRQEEYTYEHRDLWDCFAAPYSVLYEQGILGIPIINYYIKHLELYVRRWIRGVSEPRWKDGAPYSVILSHDVDHLPSNDITITLNRLLHANRDPGFIADMLGYTKELLSSGRLSKPTWRLSDWIEKEREYGFHSTFFLAANTRRLHHNDPSYWIYSKLIHNGKRISISRVAKMIEEDGWEIGLHGSMNTYIDQQLLSKEKKLLIDQTGCTVAGIRQHYLRFDVRKTWQVQESLGFSYDTTLGYNERNGFRAGIAFPFVPYDLQNEREYNLLELPVSIMDGNFFADYGEKLDARKAIQRCKKLFKVVEQTEGLLVVNFHPHYYATTHPDWWAVYEYILQNVAESGAWVATGREIADWWSERRDRLIRYV